MPANICYSAHARIAQSASADWAMVLRMRRTPAVVASRLTPMELFGPTGAITREQIHPVCVCAAPFRLLKQSRAIRQTDCAQARRLPWKIDPYDGLVSQSSLS